MSDFRCGPLFDDDLGSRRRRDVTSRFGRDNDERDTVPVRRHRQRIGADLVRDRAVGRDAVRADHHAVDLPGGHRPRRGGVDRQPVRNARLGQLPRGQPGSLQQRSRLVDQYLGDLAASMQHPQRPERSTECGGGQPAGVAVREHAQRTIGTQPQHQVGGMGGKHPVDPRVLGQHLLGLCEHGIRARGQRGQRSPHTPGQIHRGGPGRCDPGGFRRRRVGVADVRVCRQRHTERAGHPECRRTPDGQGLDRVDELVDAW